MRKRAAYAYITPWRTEAPTLPRLRPPHPLTIEPIQAPTLTLPLTLCRHCRVQLPAAFGTCVGYQRRPHFEPAAASASRHAICTTTQRSSPLPPPIPPPGTPGNEDLFTCPPNVIHVQSYVLNRTRIIDPTGPPEPTRCPPPRPPSSPCTLPSTPHSTPHSTPPTPTPHDTTRLSTQATRHTARPHSPVTIPLYSWPNGSHNNDLMSPRATRHATSPPHPTPKHKTAPDPTQPQGTTHHAAPHHTV